MTKLYEVDPEGTIQFKMGHRAWGVDVPAYVYDLWMPLIGVTAVGVYAVYSRLVYEAKMDCFRLDRGRTHLALSVTP